MWYLLSVLILCVTGCNSYVVSDSQLLTLNAEQLSSFKKAPQPFLSRMAPDSGTAELFFQVSEGHMLVGDDYEAIHPVDAHIKDGECKALLLTSSHHARAVNVCLDKKQIRIGTGKRTRYLSLRTLLEEGVYINNFLTDEDEGIYSLSMYIRVDKNAATNN